MVSLFFGVSANNRIVRIINKHCLDYEQVLIMTILLILNEGFFILLN